MSLMPPLKVRNTMLLSFALEPPRPKCKLLRNLIEVYGFVFQTLKLLPGQEVDGVALFEKRKAALAGHAAGA
jgi:hypothetical protein